MALSNSIPLDRLTSQTTADRTMTLKKKERQRYLLLPHHQLLSRILPSASRNWFWKGGGRRKTELRATSESITSSPFPRNAVTLEVNEFMLVRTMYYGWGENMAWRRITKWKWRHLRYRLFSATRMKPKKGKGLPLGIHIESRVSPTNRYDVEISFGIRWK